MIDSIERLLRETLTREVSPTMILHNFEERMIRPGMSGAALRKFELFVSDASISERLNYIWKHDKGATNWIIHQMNIAIE